MHTTTTRLAMTTHAAINDVLRRYLSTAANAGSHGVAVELGMFIDNVAFQTQTPASRRDALAARVEQVLRDGTFSARVHVEIEGCAMAIFPRH